MTVVEKESSKEEFLNLISKGVTIIGSGILSGPFENADEMKKKFKELEVDGYDLVGEKMNVDVILK